MCVFHFSFSSILPWLCRAVTSCQHVFMEARITTYVAHPPHSFVRSHLKSVLRFYFPLLSIQTHLWTIRLRYTILTTHFPLFSFACPSPQVLVTPITNPQLCHWSHNGPSQSATYCLVLSCLSLSLAFPPHT